MKKEFYNLAKNVLFPLNRSITGEGTLNTLKIIKSKFPKIKINKVKSGSKVFDWTVPSEWNVKKAYVLDKNKKKIIDFGNHNLHLMGYSIPIIKNMKKKDFFKNLYYLKNQPDAIPYVTSYYKKRWGFCITYKQFKKINQSYSDKDFFKIVIDSSFKKNGNLNYGELVLKGKSSQEILISTYVCHPSMANNELSGPIVSMGLIDHFKKKKLNKTLRFIFIPETIGSIAYLSKNLENLKKNILGGYNLTCIGDDRQYSCMLSKYKKSPSDISLLKAYKKLKIKKFKIHSFLKRGSDERQYNSPGVNLPITSIFRTRFGDYPEYHTSLDNFEVVTYRGISGGFKVVKEAIEILQEEIYPKYKIICEPQMGKRGFYKKVFLKEKKLSSDTYMDFLQYADGRNSLKEISKIINLSFINSKKIFKKLLKKKVITY
jgi:aminopeptidase-like protein